MTVDNVYRIRGRILVFFEHFFKEKHRMIISWYGNTGGLFEVFQKVENGSLRNGIEKGFLKKYYKPFGNCRKLPAMQLPGFEEINFGSGYRIVFGFNLVEPLAFVYKDQFVIPLMRMGPGFFDNFLKPGYFEQCAVIELVLNGYLAVFHY